MMNTIDNLKTRKRKLQQQLAVNGELTDVTRDIMQREVAQIDVALEYLENPRGRPPRA